MARLACLTFSPNGPNSPNSLARLSQAMHRPSIPGQAAAGLRTLSIPIYTLLPTAGDRSLHTYIRLVLTEGHIYIHIPYVKPTAPLYLHLGRPFLYTPKVGNFVEKVVYKYFLPTYLPVLTEPGNHTGMRRDATDGERNEMKTCLAWLLLGKSSLCPACMGDNGMPPRSRILAGTKLVCLSFLS